jgi:hypothetical protein
MEMMLSSIHLSYLKTLERTPRLIAFRRPRVTRLTAPVRVMLNIYQHVIGEYIAKQTFHCCSRSISLGATPTFSVLSLRNAAHACLFLWLASIFIPSSFVLHSRELLHNASKVLTSR